MCVFWKFYFMDGENIFFLDRLKKWGKKLWKMCVLFWCFYFLCIKYLYFHVFQKLVLWNFFVARLFYLQFFQNLKLKDKLGQIDLKLSKSIGPLPGHLFERLPQKIKKIVRIWHCNKKYSYLPGIIFLVCCERSEVSVSERAEQALPD